MPLFSSKVDCVPLRGTARDLEVVQIESPVIDSNSALHFLVVCLDPHDEGFGVGHDGTGNTVAELTSAVPLDGIADGVVLKCHQTCFSKTIKVYYNWSNSWLPSLFKTLIKGSSKYIGCTKK